VEKIKFRELRTADSLR